MRTTCASLNSAITKETFKKVFSDVSSLEHKNVPAVKEEVETINFNHYRNTKKKPYWAGNEVNLSDKQDRLMCCFKYNSTKHFAHDCTDLRNNTNIVMDSDQIHFGMALLKYLVRMVSVYWSDTEEDFTGCIHIT